MSAPYSQIVVTGGPGAGKTAVLELLRRQLHARARVVPEAAGILFRGGFPRDRDDSARRAAQIAIFCVQRQLEAFSASRNGVHYSLCDRGTVDGLAYWPGAASEFWTAVGSTHAQEIRRYSAVVHLHTPKAGNGYNHDNGLRWESAEEAALIDQRIAAAWRAHPRRFEVEATDDFMAKAQRAIGIIESLCVA